MTIDISRIKDALSTSLKELDVALTDAASQLLDNLPDISEEVRLDIINNMANESFIHKFDALRSLAAFLPESARSNFRSGLAGLENDYDMTKAVLDNLPYITDKGAVYIETVDRFTHRRFQAAIPVLGYTVLTGNIAKAIRELKRKINRLIKLKKELSTSHH